MTTVIFRRFRELSIRNLLNLEARVAALQGLQLHLDDEDRRNLERFGGEHCIFDEIHDDSVSDIIDIQKSWEEFAVLGTADGTRVEYNNGIPMSVLMFWKERRELRKKCAKGSQPGLQEPPSEARTGTGKKPEAPNLQDEPTSESNETKEHILTRWDLALAIQEATKEYQEAIIRYQTILKLDTPAERSVSAIRSWFEDDCGVGRSGVFAETSAMRYAFADDVACEDMMALYKSANEDLMSKFLTSIEFFMAAGRRNPYKDKRFIRTSEEYIRNTATAITLLVAMFFLVAAVWALAVLHQRKDLSFAVTIGVLTAFVLLFAMWVTIAVGARRADVFAATAAYAAVLVVFIGQG